MFIVSGLVLEAEHMTGSSADDDGVIQPYAYWRVTVLDAPSNQRIRLDDSIQPPRVGEKFTARCRVSVYRGNLAVRALERLDLDVDSVPAGLAALFAGASRVAS